MNLWQTIIDWLHRVGLHIDPGTADAVGNVADQIGDVAARAGKSLARATSLSTYSSSEWAIHSG